jgi:hypothetical protein
MLYLRVVLRPREAEYLAPNCTVSRTDVEYGFFFPILRALFSLIFSKLLICFCVLGFELRALVCFLISLVDGKQ